jgi:hypothetical protein
MDYISWKVFEHATRQRPADWFWAVGIIAFALAATAVLFKNILFGVLIVFAAFTLMLQAARKPEQIECMIGSNGVSAGKKNYPFSTLESFWIDETMANGPRLLLKSKKMLDPLIVIPIDEVHPDDIKGALLPHLSQIEMYEPLSQKIMEYLGF